MPDSATLTESRLGQVRTRVPVVPAVIPPVPGGKI